MMIRAFLTTAGALLMLALLAPATTTTAQTTLRYAF